MCVHIAVTLKEWMQLAIMQCRLAVTGVHWFYCCCCCWYVVLVHGANATTHMLFCPFAIRNPDHTAYICIYIYQKWDIVSMQTKIDNTDIFVGNFNLILPFASQQNADETNHPQSSIRWIITIQFNLFVLKFIFKMIRPHHSHNNHSPLFRSSASSSIHITITIHKHKKTRSWA